jgi:hypothetical protein
LSWQQVVREALKYEYYVTIKQTNKTFIAKDIENKYFQKLKLVYYQHKINYNGFVLLQGKYYQ